MNSQWVNRCGVAIALLVSAVPIMAQQGNIAAANGPRSTDTLVRTRSITVDLERVSLRQAVIAVSKAGGVQPLYKTEVLDAVDAPFTLRAIRMPLGEAFDRLLSGTGLKAIWVERDMVSIVPIAGTEWQTQGIIEGVVTDAKTKRPLGGVTVSIEGTKRAVQTALDGRFHIGDLTAGVHRVIVRRVGYTSEISTVVVKEGEITTLNVVLNVVVTRLNEVVTTAVGDQRRREVGNVVAHLNVDSIAKTASITNLTDLLSARAAGVQVVETNGMVGSGASIRIRGQSSLTLSSDPIVIVDGVRQDNAAGGSYNAAFGPTPSPNRLNDIDVSQIESIDILKGPAASTEYGTDAANGVIVITTKHGAAGVARWHVSAERGWSDIPGGFEEYYYGWGHDTTSAHKAVNCPLTSVVPGNRRFPGLLDGTCTLDSVTHYNPLNHPDASLFGHGLHERANVDVSGGTAAVQYYVGGSVSHDVGTMRLPDVFRPLAMAAGVPSSLFDPNTQEQPSVRASLSATVSPTLDFTLNTAYLSTRQVTPPTNNLMYGLIYGGPSVPDSAHAYGYGSYFYSPLSNYGIGSSQTQDTKRTTAGATARWHPSEQLSVRATGGLDRGSQNVQSLISPQALVARGSVADAGTLSIATNTTDIISADLQSSLVTPISQALSARTSLGWQLASSKTRGVTASVFGTLTAANPTLNGVPNPSVAQAGDGNATIGGYLEERLSLRERLYLTGALRLDAASGFGHDYHATVYPKISVSWLAVQGNTATVRLRGAFGAAGVQPENGAAYPLYSATVVYLENGPVSSSQLISPGNPDLKPERSQEFEGGLDVGVWEDRVNLELTHYIKQTKDALVFDNLGGTVGAQYAVERNLGDVRNSGFEITAQANLIRDRSVTWDATLNLSSNTNKLLHLSPSEQTLDLGGYQRDVVGYPLYGFWAPTMTYADANHDGIIELSEVTLADSSTYRGSSIPKMEYSLANTFGFFRNRLTVNALFDARQGGVIYNGPAVSASARGLLREQHDATAPLWLQARSVARALSGNANSLFFEDGSFVRFRELSATYTLGGRWIRRIRLQNLSLTAAVRNLHLWTRYSGGDPEVSDVGLTYNSVLSTSEVSGDIRGSSIGPVPLTRTWMVRVNAGL